MEQYEKRAFDSLELTNHGRFKLKGIAIPFNSLSGDLGGFKEMILPGAFDESLDQDIRALIEHDPNRIIGRTTSHTLLLQKSDSGNALLARIDPPNTTAVNDLIESIRRRDINGMSFGFKVLEDEWDLDLEMPIRYVKRGVLLEVSITSLPAYLATDVSVARSIFARKKHRVGAKTL